MRDGVSARSRTSNIVVVARSRSDRQKSRRSAGTNALVTAERQRSRRNTSSPARTYPGRKPAPPVAAASISATNRSAAWNPAPQRDPFIPWSSGQNLLRESREYAAFRIAAPLGRSGGANRVDNHARQYRPSTTSKHSGVNRLRKVFTI